MVDFASLRNQILFGEGDDTPREPSSLEKEALNPSTGIPLFLGAGTLAFCGLDKAKFDVLGAHRTLVASNKDSYRLISSWATLPRVIRPRP